MPLPYPTARWIIEFLWVVDDRTRSQVCQSVSASRQDADSEPRGSLHSIGCGLNRGHKIRGESPIFRAHETPPPSEIAGLQFRSSRMPLFAQSSQMPWPSGAYVQLDLSIHPVEIGET